MYSTPGPDALPRRPSNLAARQLQAWATMPQNPAHNVRVADVILEYQARARPSDDANTGRIKSKADPRNYEHGFRSEDLLPLLHYPSHVQAFPEAFAEDQRNTQYMLQMPRGIRQAAARGW